LHGHELGPGITPLQAGLGWVVRFDKGDFRGRDALLAERDRGVARLLRGLVVDGRQIPRSGCAVTIGGAGVGEVTSGNFSPVLERGIALAFLPPEVADGTQVTIDVRGRPVTATVVKPPFVKSGQ
jgi:aminomethyltransferase